MDDRVRELERELSAALPDGAVSSGDSDLRLHSRDESFHPAALPDLVAFPSDRAQVSIVLEAASRLRVPVVPFGAGSSLEGHVIPADGGISVDLTRMDRIRKISGGDLTATVEPGVTRLQLERSAAESGLMFPVDPGADATLGGMAATNAAGTMTARFGKMRAQVLSLEAVLPGGRVIRAGSVAPKTSAGYDLAGLLIGSEGTLAIITELTVRLRPIPEASCAVRISIDGLEPAGRLAAAIVAAGIPAARIELLDDWEVDALNLIEPDSLPAGSALLVEVSGSEAGVASDLADLEGLIEESEPIGCEIERTPAGQRALWRLRHKAMVGEQARAPGKRPRSTDVCVPVTELAGCLAATREAIQGSGLQGGIVAHAGDGNVHVGIMLDPDDPDELARSDRLVERLVGDALARGGTCTGEHGVGSGKLGALELEHGDTLGLMREIKSAFDPAGIMNPGKVLARE